MPPDTDFVEVSLVLDFTGLQLAHCFIFFYAQSRYIFTVIAWLYYSGLSVYCGI